MQRPAPDGKSRPRRRTRAEAKDHNRQALLEAARDLMMRDGYRNLLLDEVAAEAGLTKGAIYSIFGGKEEMLRALADEVMPDLAWPDLEPLAEPELPLADLLRVFAHAWATKVDMQAPRWQSALHLEILVQTLYDPELYEIHAGKMREQRDTLTRAFTGRRTPRGRITSEIEAEELANTFAALMQGLTNRVVYHPAEFSERRFAAAAVALCAMLDGDT
jgi:AcrR family transcriptional regulator